MSGASDLLRRHGKTLAVLAAALLLGIYLFADSEPVREAPAEPPAKRVKVAAVERLDEERELRFSGVTRSARRARVSFSVGGRLAARPAEIGARVGRGEVLARLDEREARNAVASARAAVAELAARRAQAERDLERNRRLAAAGAATGEELERASAQVDALVAAEEAAAARRTEAERLLGEGVLRAPFAATVTEVLLEPGEYAAPGRPVVVLSGDGEVELEVEVPESVAPRITEGATVEVELPAAGRTTSGRVASLGRTAAGAGRLFPVVVSLPSGEGLGAGMTAELVLRLTADEALSVPIEAVVNPGGRRPTVFRVEPSPGGGRRAVEVEVEVGSLRGGRIGVRGALAAGEKVVVGGQRGLLDGEAVEVVE